MGYRSDGTIVVAFESLEDMREVLAVYRLDPRVQKLNPFQRDIDDDGDNDGNWTFHDWNTNTREEPIIWYLMRLDFRHWKWYREYEDIQAYEHIATICKQFANEREDFSYAYRFVRGGEEHEDYEEVCYGSDTELSQMMVENLEQEIGVRMVWDIYDDLTDSTTIQDYYFNKTGTQSVPQTKETKHVSI
jgi:hypothetical protein